MKKFNAIRFLPFLTLTLVVACGGGGGGGGGPDNTDVAYYNGDNRYNNIDRPEAPPQGIDWYNVSYNYERPRGYCVVQSQMPTSCTRVAAGGYCLSGNYWWHAGDYHAWGMAAYGSCTRTDSGWIRAWGSMSRTGSQVPVRYTATASGKFYISVQGSYSGYNEPRETLTVRIDHGQAQSVRDLDNSYGGGSSEITHKCNLGWVRMDKGQTYEFEISGQDDSVNNVAIRLSSFRPKDVFEKCD